MDSQQFKLPDAWRFEIYSWWLLGFVPCLERFCPFSTLKHVLWCFTPMLLQFRISLSFLTYLKLIIAYGLILGTKIISKWRLSNSKVIYWMFHDFHWFKMPCLTQAKLSFIQRFLFFFALSRGDFSQLLSRCQNADMASWRKTQQLHKGMRERVEWIMSREAVTNSGSRSHSGKSWRDVWTIRGQFLLSQTKWEPKCRKRCPSWFHCIHTCGKDKLYKRGVV